MAYSLFFIILCAGWLILNGYSLTENDVSNMTSFFLDGPIGKDSDVFRQLLNQETLIRMSLVKNVHSLMQDMVTMKHDMFALQDVMETITNKELDNLKTEIDQLKTENHKLKDENTKMKRKFDVVNDKFENVNANNTQIKGDFKTFELNFEQDRLNYEQNTSGILSDIKVEVRYLSLTLLNLNQHTTDLEKNIPKLLENNNQLVQEWINDTYTKFDSELNQTNERQHSHGLALSGLESMQNSTSLFHGDINSTVNILQENVQKCQSENLKISATVSTLEIFHLKKDVGFTVGISSTSTSWSGKILVFPTVIQEIGGGYSTSNGIFTSPIDGHFVFYISVQSYPKKSIYLDIVLNGTKKVRAMAEMAGINLYLTGTNMVLLRLHKGDKVWVQRYSGSGYYSLSDAPVMTFSGFHVF